jgi:hypothetical protein
LNPFGFSPFPSRRVIVEFEAPRLRNPRQPVNQLVKREFILHELTRDCASIQNYDPVGDGIDVKDVVVDKDGRLARTLDPGDKFKALFSLGNR